MQTLCVLLCLCIFLMHVCAVKHLTSYEVHYPFDSYWQQALILHPSDSRGIVALFVCIQFDAFQNTMLKTGIEGGVRTPAHIQSLVASGICSPKACRDFSWMHE